MGFNSAKGTAGQTAVSLANPTVAGTIWVQNMGPSAVTIGGPSLVFGAGIVLVGGALPVGIQSHGFGAEEDADDSLWVVSTNQATASAVVGWVFGG